MIRQPYIPAIPLININPREQKTNVPTKQNNPAHECSSQHYHDSPKAETTQRPSANGLGNKTWSSNTTGYYSARKGGVLINVTIRWTSRPLCSGKEAKLTRPHIANSISMQSPNFTNAYSKWRDGCHREQGEVGEGPLSGSQLIVELRKSSGIRLCLELTIQHQHMGARNCKPEHN